MSQKKIIGIDAHMIGDNSGGNETYYKNLLIHLDKLNVHREIKVYLYEDMKSDVSFKNIHLSWIKSKSPIVRNFIEIPYIQMKDNISIMHMQYFMPLFNPCPLIVSIHDICFEHFRNIFPRGKYIIQKVLIPFSARNATKILTLSEYSKKDISTRYDVPEDKIIVTYCGVSDRFTIPTDPSETRRYVQKKFNTGERYLLTVGNLQPRKNISRLINVFKNLLKSTGGYSGKLVIVGKSEWRSELLVEAVKETQLDEHVVFTGYVMEDDLVKLYNAAELFVYPSIFEGFGLPPLEAMACGTPTLVSNSSSLPEVVGDAGLLFDPFNEKDIYDALVSCLRSPDLKKNLSSMGIAQAKKFSWDKTAGIVQNAYETILSSA